MFVRNSWYVAARPEEIGRKPIHRQICDTAIVLYRKQDGDAVAMQDHCPHRRFALSKGRVEGDQIRCMYHGLCFDATGVCTHIPGQDTIPASLNLRTYPIVEKYGWVWLWLGEPESAEALLIPEFSFNCTAGWKSVYGHTKIAADYRLVLDNFLDLSHVAYVHEATIGTSQIAEASMEVEYDKKSVRFVRHIYDVPVPPTFQKVRDFGGNIDRSQKGAYLPPTNFSNEVRMAPAGSDNQSQEIHLMVINTLTPETPTSTHYFWSIARDFELENEELGETIRQENIRAFDEDRDVLGIQQHMLDLDKSAVPLKNLKCDNAGVLMRKILTGLVEAER